MSRVMTFSRVLPWLLHHANRSVKDFSWGQYSSDFYRVKDSILKKYGKAIGYDIQHIEGKRCHTCNGEGLYPRWDQYGIYDPDGCWRCNATGWYKQPQWICLERIQFGPYIFHRPMKREYCVKNPFTAESLGWQVSDRPVINGYVDHTSTTFGKYALALIMVNTPDFKLIVKRIAKEWRWYIDRQLAKFKRKPKAVYSFQNDPDSELPF